MVESAYFKAEAMVGLKPTGHLTDKGFVKGRQI
jgi:hypothetical protein